VGGGGFGVWVGWGGGGGGGVEAGGGRGRQSWVYLSKPHPFFSGRRKILYFTRVNIDYWWPCSLHNGPA